MKFTPKYSTVRGEGGVLEFCLKFQTYSFGHSGGHAKFQNHSFTPSGLFLVSKEDEEDEDIVDNNSYLSHR